MNRSIVRTSQVTGLAISSSSTWSKGMAISDTSYSRLLRRIWIGNIGRNGRNNAAPAMLNILPKFELDPISTYFDTFRTVRRPCATASCTTDRSCSNRIRSAAARATSAAPSTEIPTSAACNAGASLMPSPMNPTTWPSRLRASRTRCFCCGLTRQNRFTFGSCPSKASSDRCDSASPVSTPVTGTPISAKTWRATISLSPVSTFTPTPAAAKAWIVAPALAFGGSRNTANPANTMPDSSAIAAVAWSGATFRRATPSARNPCAPNPSRVAEKAARAAGSSLRSTPPESSYSSDNRKMSSGAPLAIRRRVPACSARTETRRRSKSKGTSSILVQPVMSKGRAVRMAASSGLFIPLSNWLLIKAWAKTPGLSTPCPSIARTMAIFASVSVPVLSVHSISMAPRSWTADSRFTMTLRLARSMAERARVTVTIIGNSSGVRPTARARANISDSSTGRWKPMFTTSTNRTIRSVSRMISMPKRRTPRTKAVAGGFSARLVARCPNAVRAPVRQMTMVAVPLTTDVPA